MNVDVHKCRYITAGSNFIMSSSFTRLQCYKSDTVSPTYSETGSFCVTFEKSCTTTRECLENVAQNRLLEVIPQIGGIYGVDSGAHYQNQARLTESLPNIENAPLGLTTALDVFFSILTSFADFTHISPSVQRTIS